MNRKAWCLIAVFLAGAAAAAGPEDLVLRVTVNLVQVEATVTDGSDRPVTDLRAEDFEVRQDGKVQKITHCTYVAPSALMAAARHGAVRPENVNRTIAILVDDLGLASTSIVEVRRALRKFVDEQMQPGDLVAIFRTLGSSGYLQQFTTDKRQLYASIERIQWGAVNRVVAADTDQYRHYLFMTLDAAESLVKALKGMPGRKSVMFFSESMSIIPPNMPAYGSAPTSTPAEDTFMLSFRKIADAASRGGVVMYTFDPRGLQTVKTQADFSSQDGLSLLAKDTGGRFLHDNNNVDELIHRALDLEQGYYLLGYRPGEAAFRAKDRGLPRFHQLSVRVNRRGLTVGTRAGFYSTEDAAPPSAASLTPAQDLVQAMVSPFGSADLAVTMSAAYFSSAKEGPVLHAILHIDGGALTFSQAGESRHAVLDIASMIFDCDGLVLDKGAWSPEFNLKPDEYKTMANGGILQSLTITVKKPGAYQLRVAVRDRISGRIGSAGQFFEIPKLNEDVLGLSGIVLERAAAPAESRRDSVSRVFHQGNRVMYGFQVLNARTDAKTGRPNLVAELQLSRNGQPIREWPPAPIAVGAQTDLKRLPAFGNLSIAPDMAPGDYVLRIAVIDKNGITGEDRRALQSIDFQVQ
jgi:VWFA-related protein